jgi:hypothetical protein
MSFPDQLPLPPPQDLLHQRHPSSPSPARQQEVDLLRRLQQVRSAPELMVLRQFLAVRLALCQGRLVKASLSDVPLLQGEARMLDKLLTELSGERVIVE